MLVNFFESLILVGMLAAAVAVALVCVIGFVVWLAGGRPDSRTK